MAITDPRTASSRRALLAASMGAAGATLVAALGRPAPARAANGVFTSALGNTPAVDATNTTEIGYGVWGEHASATGEGVGVYGYSSSVGGTGVVGSASAASGPAWGVWGNTQSATGLGVLGLATHASGASRGVFGRTQSAEGAGVMGLCGGGPDPGTVPNTGVYGVADIDASSRGVYGRSNAGRGVFGESSSGQGVRGVSTTGSALYGSTTNAKKGFALRTLGRVRLDNSAGIATILSGTNSIVVTPGIDLVATSAVTATLQGSAGAATTTVSRVVVNATNDTFTIYLTANATANVKVAWHVFG